MVGHEDYPKYAKAAKKAVRINGVIQIESLPKSLRYILLKRRKIRKNRPRNRITIRPLDERICINKYYPWSYRNYYPTLVLQGWYSLKKAKQRYKEEYGNNALRFVKFIRGKDALERDFKIGDFLYINGRWIRPFNRVRLPRVMRKGAVGGKKNYIYEIAKKSYGITNPRRREIITLRETDKLGYGQADIHRTKPKKGPKLSSVQQAKFERAKSLYEE